MKHLGLIAYLFVAVFCGNVFCSEEDDKAEMKKLEGTWIVSQINEDGKDIDMGGLKAKFVFAENVLTVSIDAKVVSTGKVKINAAGKPPQIDITDNEPGSPTDNGIYALEGESLKICSSEPGTPRPTTIEAKKGSKLMVMKREEKK